MPYILPGRRVELESVVDALAEARVIADGDLNYILFKFCRTHVPANYGGYKNFIAELNECAAEIRRRFLGPYEDEKCRINGDVL